MGNSHDRRVERRLVDRLAAMLSMRPPERPIGVWLTLFGIAAGIIFLFIQKTAMVVVIGLAIVFGCFAYPLINFPWIENKPSRRIVAILVLTAVLSWFGFVVWPADKTAAIEESYDFQMLGLPLTIPASASTYIVRLQPGRKVEPISIVNQSLSAALWPGKEELFPPEGVGEMVFSNHGELSVFNVLCRLSIDIGAQNDPGGISTAPVSLPIFDLQIGQSRGFYIVNQSSDIAMVRMPREVTLQVSGSIKRVSIRLQARNMTILDQLPMLVGSSHKWSGDKILPPFLDIPKRH